MEGDPSSVDDSFWGGIDTAEAVARYDRLVDSVEDGIYQLDADGCFVGVNDMIVEITGYSRSELLGAHVSLVLDETDIERIKQDFQRRLLTDPEDQTVATYETTVEAIDGTMLICELRISLLITDGVFHGSVGIVRDVTERRRREQHIEAELEEVVERITAGFFALDTDWNFTHINERAKDILDTEDDHLVGKNLWEEFPDAVGSVFEDAYRQAMETQEPTTIEEYYPPLGVWFEDNIYPSETGLSVYFRDITERKERERKLSERQSQLEEYEQIFETVRDGVYVLDDNREFVTVNNAFIEMLGYSRDEILGEHASIVFGDRFDQLDSLPHSGEAPSATVEDQIQTATGDDITVETRFAGLQSKTGATYRVGVTRDVTRRKTYERALKESNERLEQFAYAASHDLQEPLRMISSYLQLIEDRYGEVLDEEAREFIGFAVDGADRMKAMIEGLLAYSRVETQGAPFEPVALDSVVADVCTDLRVKIEETRAEVTTESLPVVDGDTSQLRQVFQNLVDNAIEYSGDTPPRIHIDATRNGSMCVISVHDEGIGIDPMDVDRVFEVFQRLHTRDEYPGTGIGLALCRRIIERHDGHIWVDATPGEGATFSFTLPVSDE